MPISVQPCFQHDLVKNTRSKRVSKQKKLLSSRFKRVHNRNRTFGVVSMPPFKRQKTTGCSIENIFKNEILNQDNMKVLNQLTVKDDFSEIESSLLCFESVEYALYGLCIQ